MWPSGQKSWLWTERSWVQFLFPSELVSKEPAALKFGQWSALSEKVRRIKNILSCAAPSDVNTTLDGSTYPGWKMLHLYWWIKNFAIDNHSRLSSGTSNAIYNWWSLVGFSIFLNKAFVCAAPKSRFFTSLESDKTDFSRFLKIFALSAKKTLFRQHLIVPMEFFCTLSFKMRKNVWERER